MKRNWIILVAVAAAIIIVLTGNRLGKDGAAPKATGAVQEQPSGAPDAAAAAKAAPKKGSAAPAFTLDTLDGQSQYSVGGKRGKVLVVNFWASWCGPCDMEAPDLVTLYDAYKDRIDLYAVNATNYDKIRNAREFVQEKGFSFPVLTDGKGIAGDAYKVFAYPTSFIIDRDGVILQRIEGIIPIDKWRKYLDEAASS